MTTVELVWNIWEWLGSSIAVTRVETVGDITDRLPVSC